MGKTIKSRKYPHGGFKPPCGFTSKSIFNSADVVRRVATKQNKQ